MSTNHHTPYQDTVTTYRAVDMNGPLGELDAVIDGISGEVQTHASDITSLSGEFIGQGRPYDIGITYSGTPSSGEYLLRFPFPRPVQFAANVTPSRAVCRIAPSGEVVFSLRKDDVEFATVTFSGEVAGTYSASATDFGSGEVITLVAPTSSGILEDIGFSIAGTRIV